MNETIVPLGVKTGDLFHSFNEIETIINDSSKQNYVQFYKRESRTIEAGSRKTKRYLNPELKYYQVEWACVHGGRQFKCRSNGIRQSKTLKYQTPCPAQIRIKVSPDGNNFIVNNVENKHNHKVCKSLFDELPQQRKLPREVREDAKKLLDMKVNRHMLRDELERKLDKKITLRDLTNLHTENKMQYNNNIKEACEKIQSKFGADSHILVDGNNAFKGMMFCTRSMRSAMAAYPEFICLDGTYKLLNIRAPVYLILNENDNGESIIVAVGILISEDKESVAWFLESFKKENPSWNKIKTVMTDKDLVERSIITECFPGARLQICIFHVLKIFHTEITCEQFKITSSEKHTVLEYLQKLVYSKNDTEFSNIEKEMKRKISERIYQYLKKNWISIKNEWYLGAQHNNFLNTTNNRIESINAKLKQVISKHSTIGEFLDKLLTILKSLEKEQNSRLANLLNKRPTILYTCDSIEYKYQKILTPYSFIKMKKQFSYKSVRVSENNNTYECYDSAESSTAYCTTVDSCSCYFHVSMCLPCKHIFAIRYYVNENLYDENLISERWKMSYLLANNTLLDNIDCNIHNETTHNLVEVLNEKPKKILSAQEKYKLLFTKCKMAASLGVEAQGEDFNKVANLLDEIIKMLQHNIYNFKFTYTTENCENDGLSKEITLERFKTDDVGCNIVDQEIGLNNEMDYEYENNAEIICEDSRVIQDISNVNINKGYIDCDTDQLKELNEIIYLSESDHVSLTIKDCTAYDDNTTQNEMIEENSKNLECGINFKGEIGPTLGNDNLNFNKSGCSRNKNENDDINYDENYKTEEIGGEIYTNLDGHNFLSDISIDNKIYYNIDHDYSKSINEIECKPNQNQFNEKVNESKPDKNIDIDNIIVIPAKVKGRPKGRDLTVIGLPKKKKKERKSFKNKSVNEKRNIVLSWLLNTDRIESKQNINLIDLKPVDDVDVRILEVNISIIKKFLPTQLWDTVKCLKQQKKLSAIWTCPACNIKILANEPTVRCEACLHWFHITCSSYSASTSKSYWYCNMCN